MPAAGLAQPKRIEFARGAGNLAHDPEKWRTGFRDKNPAQRKDHMNTILTRLSAELIQQYESEGFWRGDTIYSLVRWNAGHKPNSFAVRDRFRRLTYRQLLEAADTLAADLAAHGVRPGQRVGVWLQSRIESVVALLACSKTGAICCPSCS